MHGIRIWLPRRLQNVEIPICCLYVGGHVGGHVTRDDGARLQITSFGESMGRKIGLDRLEHNNYSLTREEECNQNMMLCASRSSTGRLILTNG